MYPFCAIQNSWFGWPWYSICIMGCNRIQGLSTIKIRLVLCNTLRKGDVFLQNYLSIPGLKSYPTTLWHSSGRVWVRFSPLGLSYMLSNLEWGGSYFWSLVFCPSSSFYLGILPPRGNTRSMPAFAAIANRLAWQAGECLFLLGFAGICLKARSLCQPADY